MSTTAQHHIATARHALAATVAAAITKATRKQAPAFKGLKVAITAPTPHTTQHAVTNAPVVSIGGHSFKASFQRDGNPEEVLLWVNGGSTFVTFANAAQCARYVVTYLVRHVPVIVKAAVKVAVTKARKAAKQVVKKAADVFPAAKDYKVGTFVKAGLFPFWQKNATGTWRIAIAASAAERHAARLVCPALWKRMQQHGILATFAAAA